MNDDRALDSRQELMIRALYGELGEDEEQQFDQLLAQDRGAREEWEELKAARTALAELGDDERERPRSEPVQFSAPVRWPRLAAAAAAGFAAAASVFFALLLSGLRVDRIDGGMIVRLDQEPIPVAEPIELDVVTRAEFDAFAQAMVESTAAHLTDLERRQTGAQIEVAQALYDALAVHQQQQYMDLRTRLDEAVYASWQGSGR